jgi:hypothetical protein
MGDVGSVSVTPCVGVLCLLFNYDIFYSLHNIFLYILYHAMIMDSWLCYDRL